MGGGEGSEEISARTRFLGPGRCGVQEAKAPFQESHSPLSEAIRSSLTFKCSHVSSRRAGVAR